MRRVWVLILMVFFYLPHSLQAENIETSSAKDLLIKNEVETAVSMLQAIYTKHQKGEMNLEEAKKLGADLLRDLRYGSEGYFWADTTEGVNVVLYGKKEVEGKNRLENRDKNGKYYIKAFIDISKTGGGYVEYWFPKLGEKTAQPKRSYVLLFKPFGWVVGSGYYR
jgi:methyl-accepting chemotaxis protein